MSVLLSIHIYACFSLCYVGNNALQVGGFWHCQQDGMVLGLGKVLHNSNNPVTVLSGRADHFQELRWAHMVRARTGNQDPPGPEHFECAKIEFFVAPQGSLEVAAALGEGWWIKDDGVVLPAGGCVVPEQVEGVRFNPFDLSAIEGGIALGHLKGRTGAVHSGNARAGFRQMKSESALVAEHVERLTVGITGCRGIVLALIQKCTRLLPLKGIVMKFNAIHGDNGRSLVSLKQTRGSWWKLFKFSYTWVDSLDDRGWLELLYEFRYDSLTDRIGVHRLGQDLQRKHVAVAVDDEARQEVSLAERHAESVSVTNHPVAIRNCLLNPFPKQGWKVCDGLPRDHPDCDLRRAAVQSGAEKLSRFIANAYRSSGSDAVG